MSHTKRGFTDRLSASGVLQALLVILAVLAMANLGALVEIFLHPEIPYLDPEHLIVGGVTAAATAVLVGLLFFYARRLARTAAEYAEAAKALESSERRYRLLTESMKDVVWVLDPGTWCFTYVSPSVERLRGFTVDEIMAVPVDDALVPEARQSLRALVRQREARALTGRAPAQEFYTNEVEQPCKDGSTVWTEVITSYVVDQTSGKVQVLGVTRDISERRRAEDALRVSEMQLRQSQKIEAVGGLAGGIAHDFNNLLTPIIGCSELLLDSPNMGEDELLDVREILASAKRAATLTRQLLAFSRRQPLRPRVLDLNEIVGGMSGLLGRLLGEDLVLTTRLEPALWSAEVDPAQIEQVIMNLAVNARDAMPDGGRLVIETTNVLVDDVSAPVYPPLPPGRHVTIAVSDTGCGMDEETRLRVFDPFFTTKEPGKGTGLGLSTVYGIVKQSGGSVWVRSEPGRGSTFTVYLPAAETSATPLDLGSGESTGPLRGAETVLVVEDEPAVRALAARILGRQGYRVLEAASGPEALALLATAPQVDLLLTDVVLPGMSGREFAQAATQLVSGAKVLYMSGYTRDAVVHSGRLEPGIALLEKPFTPDGLARQVREVLDADTAERRPLRASPPQERRPS